MTIFALEIPNQLPPVCWTAKDEEDYVVGTIRAYPDWDSTDATFDDAVEYNHCNNHRTWVYMSADEAAQAVVDGPTLGDQRRGGKAHSALTEQVRRFNYEITDPALAVQLGAEIDATIWWTQGDRTYTILTDEDDPQDVAVFRLAEPLPVHDDPDKALDTLGDLIDQIEAQTDWRATNAGKPIRDNAFTPEMAAGTVMVGFGVRLRNVG